MRRALLPLILACLALGVLASPAAAFQQGSARCPLRPPAAHPTLVGGELPGMPVTQHQAFDKAQRSAAVQRDVAAQHADAHQIMALGTGCWEISYFKRGDSGNPLVSAMVDARSAKIVQLWTGLQAALPLARGLGVRSVGPFYQLWAWLPLALCFLLLFTDWKRLLRIETLDVLIVGGAFTLAFVIFTRTPATEGSIFLSAAGMAYLAARFISMALGYARPPSFTSNFSTRWIAFALFLLIGLRLGVALVTAAPYDVGEASLIGAQLLEHGQHLYGNPAWTNGFVHRGDTYGPMMYLSYLPAQVLWPAAASATSMNMIGIYAMAILLDLAAITGLALLGWRWGGAQRHRLALLLPLAWAACPFTFYQLLDSFHDSLVADLVIWSLVLLGRPLWRGTLIAAAAMTNFLPLVALPLFVKGTGTVRQAGRALVACIISGLLLAIPMFRDGLMTVYHSIVTYQSGRTEKMAIWGYLPTAVSDILRVGLAGTLVGIGLVVVLRRPGFTRWQVAALAAGLLCAIELLLPYWWFNYLPWFLGAAFPAMLLATTSHLSEATVAAAAPNRRTPEQRLVLLAGVLAVYLVWHLLSTVETLGSSTFPQVLTLTAMWLIGAGYAWKRRPSLTDITGKSGCALLLLSAGTALGTALTYVARGSVTGTVFSPSMTVIFHVSSGGSPAALYLLIAAFGAGACGLSLLIRGRHDPPSVSA